MYTYIGTALTYLLMQYLHDGAGRLFIHQPKRKSFLICTHARMRADAIGSNMLGLGGDWSGIRRSGNYARKYMILVNGSPGTGYRIIQDRGVCGGLVFVLVFVHGVSAQVCESARQVLTYFISGVPTKVKPASDWR